MRLSLFSLCALLLLTSRMYAQAVIDTTIRRDDGVVLDALYVLPLQPPPAAGYPAILLVHGFGGNKNNNRSAAVEYARQGYVAVAYSVRGQGQSGGTFDFFGSDAILGDLRAMIAFTGGLPGVHGARIGVEGGSQGGIHAWMAAAHGMGVRAVSSIIANGRFEEDWIADGALNYMFAAAMQSDAVRIAPSVRDSVKRAVETGDHAYMRAFLADQSTSGTEGSTSIPVACFVSYHDGFFNPTAALRQTRALAGPRRTVLYPGGHSLPPDPGTAAYARDVRDRWWSFWLKDEAAHASVAEADSTVVLFDGGTNLPRAYALSDSSYWSSTALLPADVLPWTLYLAPDSVRSAPPAIQRSITLPYLVVLGSAPYSIRSAAIAEDVTIAAIPGVARIYAGATTRRFQVNILLLDVDPITGVRRYLTRGQYEVEDSDSLSEPWIDVPLNSVLYTLRAGHQLEVQIHSGSPLLPDFVVHFGNTPVPTPDNTVLSIHTGGSTPSSLLLSCLNASTTEVEARASTPLSLSVPAPHPLHGPASLRFTMPDDGYGRLELFDLWGRRVALLRDGWFRQGEQTITFDVSSLHSGTYLLRLSTLRAVLSRMVHVLR